MKPFNALRLRNAGVYTPTATVVRTTIAATPDGGWQSPGPYTIRQNVGAAGILDFSGNYIRVKMTVPALSQFGFDKLFVSRQGAATFDQSGTPAQITWDGGSASKIVDNTGSGAPLVIISDWVPFVEDGTHALVFVALSHSAGLTSNDWLGESGAANMSQAYKLGDDTATLVAAGYTNHIPPKDMFPEIAFGV